MRRFFCLAFKDILLLFRDKLGLFVLFVMPMLFIFTITFLQASKPQDRRQISIMVAAQPQAQFLTMLESSLKKKNQFSFKQINLSNHKAITKAKRAVLHGNIDALLIVPAHYNKLLARSTQKYVIGQSAQAMPELKLYFNPVLSNLVRQTMLQQLRSFVRENQMQTMSNILSGVLGTKTVSMQAWHVPIVEMNVNNAVDILPNPVQQNVPAWALFGMFFIALPLAGMMLREREQSVHLRFMMAPVSQFTLLCSRLFAFLLINLLQLWFMLLIGTFIMPLFGLPALSVANHVILIFLIGIVMSLVATSFGLLVGMWSTTVEQASAFVPIVIVLAAAVGGIMVPFYMMPNSLYVVAHFSPLYWGQHALTNVLVRQLGLLHVWPSLLVLLIFAAVFFTVALLKKLTS